MDVYTEVDADYSHHYVLSYEVLSMSPEGATIEDRLVAIRKRLEELIALSPEWIEQEMGHDRPLATFNLFRPGE